MARGGKWRLFKKAFSVSWTTSWSLLPPADGQFPCEAPQSDGCLTAGECASHQSALCCFLHRSLRYAKVDRWPFPSLLQPDQRWEKKNKKKGTRYVANGRFCDHERGNKKTLCSREPRRHNADRYVFAFTFSSFISAFYDGSLVSLVTPSLVH